MEVNVGDLRARAVRLRMRYLGDVLCVGLCLALFGALAEARDVGGDLSLVEIYAFVGPGALTWAVTGSRRYGGWACGIYVFVVLAFGGVWLSVGVSSLAFWGLGSVGWYVSFLRADGWTWRRAFRTVLVRVGRWLEVEVRQVEPVVVEAPDRPNTYSENVAVVVVWVCVVCSCVGLGYLIGEFLAALWVALAEVLEDTATDRR